MEWRHTSSSIKKKFKQTIPTRKIMCTVFWDRKSVLLVELLPQGSTINAGVYCDTLKKLRSVIQNKRCGMLSRGVVMCHDDACPHIAATTQDLIATFGWEQFDHPPYSPDLASSDFHVFLHLKTFFGGWRFHDNSEVKEAVNTWFASQVASFYDAGIQKLVPRYDKGLNNGGNYVEK
jgi:histone-lysine N-methyltransferase SETMAR